MASKINRRPLCRRLPGTLQKEVSGHPRRRPPAPTDGPTFLRGGHVSTNELYWLSTFPVRGDYWRASMVQDKLPRIDQRPERIAERAAALADAAAMIGEGLAVVGAGQAR